jgi:hypothetical protein
MSFDLSLHRVIEKYNILEGPTAHIGAYFQKHPSLYKTALLVNHVFRAASMAAFNHILPFSLPVNIAICFAGSLFYRLSVETHCAYKFALPAFAGSLAVPMALSALANVVNGVAFTSLGVAAASCVSLLPLTAYLIYVIATVSYDVDNCRK